MNFWKEDTIVICGGCAGFQSRIFIVDTEADTSTEITDPEYLTCLDPGDFQVSCNSGTMGRAYLSRRLPAEMEGDI